MGGFQFASDRILHGGAGQSRRRQSFNLLDFRVRNNVVVYDDFRIGIEHFGFDRLEAEKWMGRFVEAVQRPGY